jgi:serine/threonine protein kinase
VFEVIDTQQSDSSKVIKILKSNSFEEIDLFEKEAISLQLLNHPGIPKVDADGLFKVKLDKQKLYCLVLEKIPGVNLEEWLRKHGVISEELAIEWLQQLTDILAYLHQNQFFHRDLKPSNLILRPDGRLTLIDFGAIRAISETYLLKIRNPESQDITRIISEGYTPPEQANGRALLQSDFYALGRTFVHLLTNEHPSSLPTSPKTQKLLWHHKAPQISLAFADWLDTLMSPNYQYRPQSANEILKQLEPNFILRRKLVYFGRSPLGIITILLTSLAIITTSSIWYQILQLRQQQEVQAQTTDAQQMAQVLEECSQIQNTQECDQYFANNGRDAMINNRLSDAQTSLSNAIRLNPSNPQYHNDLGLVCTYLGDYTCAKEELKKALELASQDPERWVTEYNLAFAYERFADGRNRQEDYNQAIEKYLEVINQNEDEIRWYAVSRWARLQLWRNQNSSEVIPRLQIALEEVSLEISQLENTVEPNEADTAMLRNFEILKAALLKNLGWAEWLQNNTSGAEEVLQESYALVPDQASTSCLLAQVLETEGKAEGARQFWTNCLNNIASFGDPPEVTTWRSEAHLHLRSME